LEDDVKSVINAVSYLFDALRARYRLARYLMGTQNVLHMIQTAREDLEILAGPNEAGFTHEDALSEASDALAQAEAILRYLRPDILPSDSP